MMKKLSAIVFALLICIMLALPAFADTQSLPRLVDNADLLSNSEEEQLLSELDEISERQQFDVVIVTVDSLEGKSPREYADDFYDYNGYGYGDSHDGALLLVSMEDRDWYVSTIGYGIEAITDYGLELMADEFLPYLSDGDYLTAFTVFAQLCDDYITQANTDEPYDIGNYDYQSYSDSNYSKEPLSLLWIPIAIIIGMVCAFIICGIMKSNLKSVKFQSGASSYIRNGSMNVTESRDIFLYRNISRVARPKDNNTGGSSTHFSSSGRSHGGGGGKF